jgi:nicotinate dehydrogenase subunit B
MSDPRDTQDYEERQWLEEESLSLNPPLNRRDFLKASGGILVAVALWDDVLLGQEAPGRPARPQLPTDFNAFLRIGEDGRVTCFTGKIEMGQGPITSLAQELADELDVPLESVDMIMGDTDLCPWDMGTFGSMTTRFFGPPLRAAGAEGRRVLLELAAEQLKEPVERLATADGAVFVQADPQRRVTYAALAKGQRIERHVTGATVKKPSEFKLIGKPFTRRDARQKVTGEAKFAGDIQLPGMLHAKILRPPAHGATLLEADLAETKEMEGVRVIQDGDLIAVLHARPDMAELALAKIKTRFHTPAATVDNETIFDHLLQVAPEGQTVAQGGDLAQGAAASTAVVEGTYLNDYVAHAPMEPHTAVARVEGGKATVWASTQTPFPAKAEVAKALGFPPENVRVMPVFVGGGFGGKTRNLQIVEAARLSKLCGQPVQVAWSRAEEFFYDSFRPAAVVKIRGGVSAEGRLSLWDYHVYFAGERGSAQFYDIPAHRTLAHNAGWVGAAGSHPFATGAWRAPGNNTNTYARECHIQLLAAQAGVDPVEFRLRNLKDPRMIRTLKAAAEKFGWTPAKPPSGRGLGVACGIDAGTYVAAIAEASVDKASGRIRVKRVVCAQDMGLVINPAGATIQMEGCINMGLGYALTEGLKFKSGEILDRNFDTYELPRFSWVPKIETVILQLPDDPPQGGGEPAIIVMGAVVANAVHDAAGVMIYRLPMTPARVKEALGKAAKG